MNLEVVILAAGNGTRMRSTLPKVLHELGGFPLLKHVIATAQELAPKQIHVVYGNHGEIIQAPFQGMTLNWVHQKQQLGTGHALAQALGACAPDAIVLVLYGDVPLISVETLTELLETVSARGVSFISAVMGDPTGLGRIVRDQKGNIVKIVEHKDASDEEMLIDEIFSGIIAASQQQFSQWLPKLQSKNKQNEYYLTEVIAFAAREQLPVNTVHAACEEEVQGVNDRLQLAALERYYQYRVVEALMLRGVTLRDPTRVDIRGEVMIAADVEIDVNVVLSGKVVIGSNSYIGPNCVLTNATIGENVEILANSVIEDAQIHDNCCVGPFARLRPGTALQPGVRIGNFVEVKKSLIGEGSKINHLSYVGDATVGRDVNIGAGTITVNYDGHHKHATIIEKGASIGSNSSLVAPIHIGEYATIGAGSVLTKDAPASQLTLARASQKSIANWPGPRSVRCAKKAKSETDQ